MTALTLDVGSGHLWSHEARGHINIDLVKPGQKPPVFIQCDAHKLPLKDNCVTRVIFYDVIEHVESPIQVLREINRVLQPGGQIEVSTPNVLHFRRFLRVARKKPLALSDTAHITAYTEAELRNILLNTGFHKIQISYVILPITEVCDRGHMWIDKVLYRLYPGAITGRSLIARANKVI